MTSIEYVKPKPIRVSGRLLVRRPMTIKPASTSATMGTPTHSRAWKNNAAGRLARQDFEDWVPGAFCLESFDTVVGLGVEVWHGDPVLRDVLLQQRCGLRRWKLSKPDVLGSTAAVDLRAAS